MSNPSPAASWRDSSARASNGKKSLLDNKRFSEFIGFLLAVAGLLFALSLAFVNEIIWRNFSTAAWVAFKVWGILPLIFVFALVQTPLLMKHQRNDTDKR